MNGGVGSVVGDGSVEGFAVGVVANVGAPVGDVGTALSVNTQSIGIATPVGSASHDAFAVAGIEFRNTSGMVGGIPAEPFTVQFSFEWRADATISGGDPAMESGFTEGSVWVEINHIAQAGGIAGRFNYPDGGSETKMDDGIFGEVVVGAGETVSIRLVGDSKGEGNSVPEPGFVGLMVAGAGMGLGRRRR